MPGFSYLKPGRCLRDLAGRSAGGSRGQKQEFKQKLGHSMNLQTYIVSLLVGDASLRINKPQLLQPLLEPHRSQPVLVALPLPSIQCPGELTARQAHKSKCVAFSFQGIFKFLLHKIYFYLPSAFLFHLRPYNVVCSIGFFQPSSTDLLGTLAKLFVNTCLGSMPEKRNKNLLFFGQCDCI